MTTEQIIELIEAAGLDRREFKCEIIARRVTHDLSYGDCNVWEHIAEFPWRYGKTNAEMVAKAWGLAGMPDPHLDEVEAA